MRSIDDLIIDVLLVVAVAAGAWYGAHHYGAVRYDAGHAAAIEERARADAAAVFKRTQSNATVAVRQAASNATITEKKHEELAPVIRTVYVDRVRIGSASCGPAAAPEAESPGGGNGTNPPGRLVREDVERDTRAVEIQVEEAFATARSCQAFVRANGMAP